MAFPGGVLGVLRAAVVLAGAACAFSTATAVEWPDHPVRIVNTFAAGGAADVMARTAAEQLSRAFGQQFFVETRAGASGTIGLQSVIHTDPDGYNLAVVSLSVLAITPVINRQLGYDPVQDVTPIAYLGGTPIALLVNAAGGPKTLAEFLDHARHDQKPLTYSTSGIGSQGQLIAETFAHDAGIKVELVPYKGASQGLTDLAGGQIAFSAQTLSSASGLLGGHVLRALALTAATRVIDYEQIPTFKELGYPDLVAANWFALLGPPGMSEPLVEKINQAIAAAMAKPEAQARLRSEGLQPEPMNAPEFKAFVSAEIARWKPVIERLGLAQ